MIYVIPYYKYTPVGGREIKHTKVEIFETSLKIGSLIVVVHFLEKVVVLIYTMCIYGMAM